MLCSVVPKELRQYALSKRAIEKSPASQQTSLKRQASGSFVVAGSIKRSRSDFVEADDDSIEIVAETHFDPQEESVDDDIVITGFKSPHKPLAPSTKAPPKATPKPQLGAKDLQIFRISPKALE